MKFPFLASSIIFVIWLAYKISKTNRINKNSGENFWEKETRANATRKQSLESLEYVTLPMEILPFAVMPEDSRLQEIHKTLKILNDSQIVNFTGITNTDLKLKYGAPNISRLTEYDQNFTLLVRTLQKWADILYENNYQDEAKTVLLFAVSSKTDVSRSYRLLADIYFAEGSFEKIHELVESASQLNSLLKDSIVHTLQESYPYNG